MSKFELIKELEYLSAFQSDCLKDGRWDDFDKAEGEIKKIEAKLLQMQGSE